MEIIPVLDLMNGLAVHARHGRRESYQPLQSPLCASAEPQAVVAGLLRLHPFQTVYVADLDALMGRARQTAMLESLRRAFPQVVFWIDQGLPDHGLKGCFRPEDNAQTVIGSESLSVEQWGTLEFGGNRFILSLDFREEGLLGPAPLLECPDSWPERIILMSLPHVGGMEGPDFTRAEQFQARYPGHRYIAAGGVRDENDLRRLEDQGLAGVLLASALHSGAVDARVLRQYG